MAPFLHQTGFGPESRKTTARKAAMRTALTRAASEALKPCRRRAGILEPGGVLTS